MQISLGGKLSISARSFLQLLLIVTLFGSLAETSYIPTKAFTAESPVATKFRPAFAYNYLTNLLSTNADELIPSTIWLTQDTPSSTSMDEFEGMIAENLTKQYDATIDYVARISQAIDFRATVTEILSISSCEFVKYVDINENFGRRNHICLDVAVPTIRADEIAGFPNNGPYNGSGIKVCVLDSGINETHPDLAGKVILEKNFVTGENTTLDLNGHGTFIAGEIAGTGNASGRTLYRGVAPGVQILNARVANENGDVNTADEVTGIHWAVDNGANIISCSIGITPPGTEMEWVKLMKNV